MKVSAKQITIIIISVVIFVLLCFCLKYMFLCDFFYKDNEALDKNVNNEIEQLVLNTMRNRHSSLWRDEDKDIYTSDCISEYVTPSKSQMPRSVVIVIDNDFMDTVKKVTEDSYTANVQIKWPEDWEYYLTIDRVNGKFLVSKVEIDP